MTEVTLGQPLPPNVRMRDIPWDAQVGQAIVVGSPEVANSQMMVSEEMAQAMREVESAPAEAPPSTGSVSVADLLAAKAEAAPAPAPPPEPDRLSRLESAMAAFIEAQTRANTPPPVAAPPPAPTSIDVNRLRANPLQALKEAGVDISAFAPHMPGAKVEPEQRLELTAASLRAEFESTMATKLAELEAREQAFMAQQRQTQIQSGLQTIDAKLYPTTAVMVKQVDDPSFLTNSIAQGFDVLKSQGHPNPTMADVLSALEAHWSKFAKWTAPATPAPQATVPPPTAPPTSPSVAATHTQPPRVRGWEQPVDPNKASALKTFLEETRGLKFR